MEDLISPFSGGALYKDGDYYTNKSDRLLYTIGKNGKIITIIDPICAGSLDSLGNDFFYSNALGKKFFLDRNREIITPMFLDDEINIDSSYEEAQYDGVSLIGNETGKKVVVDDYGVRLTGLELLKRKSREFQGESIISRTKREILLNMSEQQRRVFELRNKGIEEYTLDDIIFMVDGIVGDYKDDEYLSVARPAMIELLGIQLANMPRKPKQEIVPENTEERIALREQVEKILYMPQEPEYQFDEYQKPLDYDERIYSIGMSVLENGIQNMTREDYEYLYNSVDKKKAFENYEIDKKDLKVMEVSLEYMKNLETSISR